MTAVISAGRGGWYGVAVKLNPSAAAMFASWWTGGLFLPGRHRWSATTPAHHVGDLNGA